LAGQLHRQRIVFSPPSDRAEQIRYRFDDDDVVDSAIQRLMDWVPRRSVLQPFVSGRIILVLAGHKPPLEPELTIKTGGALDATAKEYAKYIHGLAGLPTFLKSAMAHRGEIFDVFAAAEFNPMRKLGGFQSDVLVPALALLLPTYLLASKWAGEQRQGQELSLLKTFVAEHPLLSTIGLLTGYRALGLNQAVDRLLAKQ
jgi:hypothetical protein